jgi:hypothetical protein
VLFGQYPADQTDRGVAVGEETDDVGAAPNFLVDSIVARFTLIDSAQAAPPRGRAAQGHPDARQQMLHDANEN